MSVQEPAHSAFIASFPPQRPQSAARLNSEIETPSQVFLARIFAGDKAVVSSTTVLSMSVILAISGATWAVLLDVAYPIAAAAGLCILAACISTYAALLVILNFTVNNNQSKAKPEPSLAWKLVDRFRISDASRLWCNIEPGCPASQESLAWTRAMLDAIQRGELPISDKMGDSPEFRERERVNPSWRTEIERDALAAWAKAHGHTPRFLNS